MCPAGALRGCPASTTRTLRRDRASATAPLRPAAPPPMTTTSYFSSMASTVRRDAPGTKTALPVRQGIGRRLGLRPCPRPKPTIRSDRPQHEEHAEHEEQPEG